MSALQEQKRFTTEARHIKDDGVGRIVLVDADPEVWGEITRIQSIPERPDFFDVIFKNENGPTQYLMLRMDEQVTLLE